MIDSANINQVIPRRISLLVAGMALVFAAGCSSTPASRIASDQLAFNSYPPQVQQAIQAGRVEVGFYPEQVRLALGRPDRIYSRQGPEGYSETWTYWLRHTSFALGVGIGGGGHSGGYGGGVGVANSAGGGQVRVVFAGGRVVSVEVFH